MILPTWAWILIASAIVILIASVVYQKYSDDSENKFIYELKIDPDSDNSEIKNHLQKINENMKMMEASIISNSNKIKALQMSAGIRNEQLQYLTGTTNSTMQAVLDS